MANSMANMTQNPDRAKDIIKPEPGLYVTATPIGNLSDMTYRAVEILKNCDLVLCEDTRQTAKLMQAYGIDTPRAPYHEHNAAKVRPGIIRKLQEGAAIALVSDAGTPLISDPGYKLVREAIAAGHRVTTLPGPSAPLAALVLSGLPSDRFLFAGFLPPKSAGRRAALAELAAVPATLVMFESAGRLADSLADMAAVLGPRPAAVARELTKLYEEVRRGRLDELADTTPRPARRRARSSSSSGRRKRARRRRRSPISTPRSTQRWRG